MKKLLVISVILVGMLTLCQNGYAGGRRGSTGTIIQSHPAYNWTFNRAPIQINFRWQKPSRVNVFALIIERKEGNSWVRHLTRDNLRTNSVTVTYDRAADFRWQVLGRGIRGGKYQSTWRHGYFRGRVIPDRGASRPARSNSFTPRLLVPKHKAVLTNYPRNMTFKWTHSSNPAYRNYQIQIDVYHPRPRKWGSEMRRGKLLVNLLVRGNRFDYKYPADRVARWRVRGVAANDRVTPWSNWRLFSYRARH